MGFAAFRTRLDSADGKPSASSLRALPATHPPFEEFPHQQPYRVTTAITFMPLPRASTRRPTRSTTLYAAETALHVAVLPNAFQQPKLLERS